MKIIIADDEEIVRTSLNDILKKSNHEVIFAVDGEEALRKAKEGNADLLLLDLDMPKLNGYEVLKQIRQSGSGLPVVFITGTGESRQVARSISQFKLNGFIEKPFTPEQVLGIINEIAEKQKAGESN